MVKKDRHFTIEWTYNHDFATYIYKETLQNSLSNHQNGPKQTEMEVVTG